MKWRYSLLFGVMLMVLISLPVYSHAQTASSSPASSAPLVILLKNLSLGSSGQDVNTLQQFLRELGYFTYPNSTSFFGSATKAAVIAFQRDNGIDALGVVGPVTRARIAVLSSAQLAAAIAPVPSATSTPNKKPYHSSGGGGSKYTVGGTVSGLSGTGLVLQNNGGDNLRVAGNGSFAFQTPIAPGYFYTIAVLANPVSPSQTCAVSEGGGMMLSANVDAVSITCSTDSYTVASSGDGNESIAPSAPQAVVYGSTQSFVVTANSGYVLSNTVGGTCPAGAWSGGTYATGAITSSCTVTFSSHAPAYSLSVTKAGTADGTVTSVPAGINCGPTCSASYSSGTVVTLNATPAFGFLFMGWSGACTGLAPCSVTLSGNTSVTATFGSLDES